MAKNQKISLIVVACLVVVAIGLYGMGVVGSAKKGDSDIKRMKITPHNIEDMGKLKSMVNVRHEFDGKFTANVTDEQLAEISQIAEVENVQIYKLTKKKEDFVRVCSPNNQMPYGIQMLNGGSGGEGVSVAVLDTGVLEAHPDYDVKVCKNTLLKGVRNGCDDDHGHGTHTTGTVGANAGLDTLGIYGVAPEAELWQIKVCDYRGYCYGDDIAVALKYVARRGVDIVSMSFYGDSEEDLITEAVEYAADKGVLLIASAGNQGPNVTIGHPASHVDVIAVAAVDSNKNVTYWSSRGVNDGDYIIEDSEVEFAAPGSMVESSYANGCYVYMSGTSMSAPHIAGLAAKLWQGTAESTRTYLQELAKLNDLDAPGDDPATGFGLPIAP